MENGRGTMYTIRSVTSGARSAGPRAAKAFLMAVASWAWLPGHAAAQATGAISGRITEAGGTPIAGAQVVLNGGQLGTLSNDVGTYTLRGVAPGSHAVLIERIGFS